MPKENMSKLGIHRVTCQKVFLKTFKKLDLIGTNILTPLPTHPPHTHTHTYTSHVCGKALCPVQLSKAYGYEYLYVLDFLKEWFVLIQDKCKNCSNGQTYNTTNVSKTNMSRRILYFTFKKITHDNKSLTLNVK